VSIEIANESGIDVDEADLSALARYVLDGMRMHPLAELSVLLVDRETMSDLHERWMGEPGPTDVLAFPMDELRPPPPGTGRADQGAAAEPASPPGLLGDVVLCPEVAADQAGQAQHPLRDELEMLCTHGILHLLGYDHAEASERTAMFGLQDELLRSWHATRDEAPAEGADPASGPRPEPASGRAPERSAEPVSGRAAESASGPGPEPASGRAAEPASGPGHDPEGRKGPG
jgi:probable rRNA maturation factor